MEQKIFTPLHGADSQEVNEALSQAGFRRSQHIIYRPHCRTCSACVSTRIPAQQFTPSRGQRRILARNSGLRRSLRPAVATDEQYELFRRYIDARHADGAMAQMDAFDFAAMIEDTAVRTHVVEYRDAGGDLVAAALTDGLRDGLSMVYSFFDPDLHADSPGVFMVLDHVSIVQRLGAPYLYLGYWIKESPKMAYKGKFSPLEGLVGGEWAALPPR